MRGPEQDQPNASGAANAWGEAVDDVTVFFDYAAFEPVTDDEPFVELTRVERSIERARDSTSRWRRHVEDLHERLRTVLRVGVALVALLTGVASVLGVEMARVPFVATCALVIGTFTVRRLAARRRARRAAQVIAAERRALTLIDGPRRVPVDVLRLRDGRAGMRSRERIDSM